MKRLWLVSGLAFIALLLLGRIGQVAPDVALARQATDVIRRNPTATTSPTPVPAVAGWRGQIVSNTPYATSGNGSIVRVHVFERVDEPITLTRYDAALSALSGTKPEYGSYAAEFAPVPAGRWTVSLPGLGASVEIETDGYNLVVVEFAPYTLAEATVAAQISPTSTPIGVEPWEGRVLRVEEGPSLTGAILHVTVQGQAGHTVQVSTPAGFVTQSTTGEKEELGPYTAEFAPLTTGRYTITPAGLNTSIVLDLDWYTTVVVEFRPVSDWPRPTATPMPVYVPSTPTYTPSPTPTPAMQWVGAILRHDRPSSGKVFTSIAVRVNGLPDLPVTLTSGDTAITCVTGEKPEYGDYACEFGGLSSGTYYVTARGLMPVIPVMVGQGDFVLAEFRQEPVPPGQIIWQGRVVGNSSQPWPGTGVSSAIAVRVEGRRGQVVSLRSSGGWEAFCYTGTKPEYGDYACEFGGLWPGVYTVSPVDISAEVQVYMDGVGFAEVAFEPVLEKASPTPIPTRLIGAGASPVVAQATDGEVTLTPSRTPTPARLARVVTATSTRPRPVATITPTPTLTPTLTPTPALGWVGRVAQDDYGVGVGTIVVRVLGMNDQPVILRSGPWSIRGLTGSKPEYGEHAVEFGGLNGGDFEVELEGLGAVLPVHLQPGGFLLLEFRYDVLPTPTPTPRSGIWVGAVTSNTSGDTWSGAWSTIIVKIPGVDGLSVTLDSNGGFVTTCITGTKPEYGPGACEVGGLWPATYRVIPEGLGPSVDVRLDGLGSATVEFWIQ